jgi:hypothetical protein
VQGKEEVAMEKKEVDERGREWRIGRKIYIMKLR